MGAEGLSWVPRALGVSGPWVSAQGDGLHAHGVPTTPALWPGHSTGVSLVLGVQGRARNPCWDGEKGRSWGDLDWGCQGV